MTVEVDDRVRLATAAGLAEQFFQPGERRRPAEVHSHVAAQGREGVEHRVGAEPRVDEAQVPRAG